MKVRYRGNKRVLAVLMILGLLLSCTFVGLATNKTSQHKKEIKNRLKRQKNAIENLKQEVRKLRKQVNDLKSKLEKTKANQDVIASTWLRFIQFYDHYIKNSGEMFVPNEEWNNIRKGVLAIFGVDVTPSYNPSLGAHLKTVNEEVAQEHYLSMRYGVLVTQVYEDTSASTSGLQKGDVIFKVDGKKVKNASQFIGIWWSSVPGTHLKLKIMRNGEFKQVKIVKPKID